MERLEELTIEKYNNIPKLNIVSSTSYEEVNVTWKDKSINVVCSSNTFNNCQVFTIGSFDNLLISLSSPYSDLTIDELREFMREMQTRCNDKRFLCINILEKYELLINDIFGESCIVVKQKYENRPSIFMHLYLIDLDKSLYTPRYE